MAMPPSVRDNAIERVAAFCERRIPAELADEIRLEYRLRGNSITIVERRPPWRPDAGTKWSTVKVAQLRYDDGTGKWSLFAPDSQGRWHAYGAAAASNLDPLLAEVDADPTGIFWG
jgi:DUF3024 family protein